MRKLVFLLLTLTCCNAAFSLEFTDALMVLTPNGALKTNSHLSENTIIDDDTTNINDWIFTDFAVANDGQYYMASNEGISISDDAGTSWTNIVPSDGLVSSDSSAIAAHHTQDDNWILVGSRSGGISFSTNNGTTFSTYNAANDSLISDNINSVAMNKDGNLYIATDDGLSIGWDAANSLFFENINTDFAEGLASNHINQLLIEDTNSGPILYLATDNGLSVSSDGGWGYSSSLLGKSVSSIAVHNDVWYVGVVGTGAGLYISIDQGATYTHHSVEPAISVWNVEVTDFAIYVGTTEGLAVSTDGGEKFIFYTEQNSALEHDTINGIKALGNSRVQLLATENGLAVSENSGLSHSIFDSSLDGIESDEINSVEYLGGENLLITNGSGVSISGDFGESWRYHELGNWLNSSDYNSTTGLIVIGSNDSGAYISKDSGQTFTYKSTANGLLSNVVSSVAIADDGTIYLSHETADGADQAGVSYSTDQGSSFTALPLFENDNILDSSEGTSALEIFNVEVSKSGSVFLATESGLYVSSDQLTSFTRYLDDSSILTITLVDNESWYIGHVEGISISHDGGNSFINSGEESGISIVQNIFIDEHDAIYINSGPDFKSSVDNGITFTSAYNSRNAVSDSIVFAFSSQDTDADGFPDKVDADDDNDGVLDISDVFPLDAAESVDTDNDGTGNNADTDDDGDGVEDQLDYFSLISLGDLTDTDSDGIPDVCDQSCLDSGMMADVYPFGIIYVNDNSTCDALTETCGVTWETAFPYLQDALSVASTNNNIWVAQGIYYPDEKQGIGAVNDSNSMSDYFEMQNYVGLYGGFSDDLLATQLSDADYENNLTILSGDIDKDDTVDVNGLVAHYTDISDESLTNFNSTHIIKDNSQTSYFVLQGFIINAAEVFSNTSGSVYLKYSGGLLKDLEFIAHRGKYGSAITLAGTRRDNNCSSMELQNINIKNSYVSSYGIIYIDYSPCENITIDGLSLTNNVGGTAFEIGTYDNVSIDGLVIENDGNDKTAVYIETGGSDATISLENSLISGASSAISVGGYGGKVNVSNTTITSNTAAIEISENSNVFATHLTLVANETGISVNGASTLSLTNSIVSNNEIDSVTDNINLASGAQLTDGGYNIIGDSGVSGFSDVDGFGFNHYFDSGTSFTTTETITDIISTALAENGGHSQTLMPVVNSIIIDAIPLGNCSLSIDPRGQSRPYNNACDIGAVEVQLDTDNDSIENFIDLDDDGDGVADSLDAFPLGAAESIDSDGDGVGNNRDAFPDDANESQDSDGDGVGDNSDADPLDPNIPDNTAPMVVVPENILVATLNENGTSALDDAIALFLSLATASDNVDGILNNIGHDAPDIFPLGNTQVTFSASDAAGNTGFNTAMVTVADETPPTMVLIGAESITINVGEEYSEQGASALDNVDGDVSNNIAITGLVDSSTLGLYTLSYNVTDMAGNIASTISRSVSVQDSFAPVISVPISIEVATTDNLGIAKNNAQVAVFLNAATALDETDGDIDLVINDAAEILAMGTHIITFSAMDLSGNTGFGQASITVSDLTAPVINLLGLTSQTLSVGDTYSEMGASALDNVDGDISEHLVISGNLDTSKVGIYNLTYDVSDHAGNNAATAVRVITVQDMEAPVVTAPASITVPATDANGTDAINASIAEFLNAASAQDEVDGEISTILNDAPNTFALGVTSVVFTAQDSNGNVGFSQSSVTVIDQFAPVLILAGEVNLLINVADYYVEQGATATDNVDGDITANIVVTGKLDVSVPGTYVKTYAVTDATGNESSLSRTISVQDVSAPVLVAPDAITVNSNDASGVPSIQAQIIDFLNSVVALDDVDGDIQAINNDAPQIFNLGSHTITFSAIDSAGNKGFASSTIDVVDADAPVINLIGAATISLALHDTYDEPGVSALDSVDGDISSQIVITNNVNTTILGSYEVHYSVTDASGNSATASRRVIVNEVESAGIGSIHWYGLVMLLMILIRQRQYK